jgi:hypothetical protein
MRSRQSVHYVGGDRGGTQRNRTYYPGVRPHESGIVRSRQALVRRYGQQSVAVTRSGSSSIGHTSGTDSSGVDQGVPGLWRFLYGTIADNTADTFNFGTATDIAAIFGWMEIKRHYSGGDVRELRSVRIAQVASAAFMGTEVDRNSSDDSAGVTIVASISGGNLILTLTTTNEAPDAAADVQLIYTVLAET